MRKLASVRRIDAINPIPDADAIEVATVGGWKVVVKRGEYSVGDLAVYCEIDSWIPNWIAPFLSKGEPKEYNGVKGERLRTIRLRGQVSQGLLLPMSVLTNFGADLWEGADVTEPLRIQKYEPPMPAQLAGEARGLFPSFIPKTDQERIQNLTAEFSEWKSQRFDWEVTEKLDGSSMTVYVFNEDQGVCSRNLNLKETEGNTFWKVAVKHDLFSAIRSTGRNLALQGELVGEGIQGNPYKMRGHAFFLYDIYDINRGEYIRPTERFHLAQQLGITHVPIVHHSLNVGESITVEDILFGAEGKSHLNDASEREGFVYKAISAPASFKAISNKFLLKHGA